jgi:hypothetical protein
VPYRSEGEGEVMSVVRTRLPAVIKSVSRTGRVEKLQTKGECKLCGREKVQAREQGLLLWLVLPVSVPAPSRKQH